MAFCRHCGAPLGAAGIRFCGRCGVAVDEDGHEERDHWLGRLVDRRYRVLDRLGSGGMGVVYRVEHMQLGKFAAMKVLHRDGAKNKEVVRRFHLEAQSVSQLNHPNIVQTFDFGQWDGSLYLIMEYVKGEDLGAVLSREGPIPFRRAAKLFVQVCSALTEAHDAGIIHRDLKPENLMTILRRDGSEHAKVLDFGLAKLRERGESPAITGGGAVVGTPYYMSPEQVRAEPLDARADVYSLGATFYRVVTGLPPFQAPSPVAVLSKHLTEKAVPPGELVPELGLPIEVDRVVMRAMAKSPSDRYASAAEIQADLEAILAATPRSDGAGGGSGEFSGRSAAARTAEVAESPTVAIESDLGDGGMRLRRRDLDEFEASLRRRKLVSRLIVPGVFLLLLGVAGGIYVRQAPRAVTSEREPNNAASYANPIASDTPVKGSIGKMLEGGKPDLDYFQIPAGNGARAISARLQGIPDVDLVVELFDAQGRRIAKADARGRGGGEWLQPTALGPAGGYLLVREEWVDGQTPTENPGDRYTLAAHWGPPESGWEVEPNDWMEGATPVSPGRALRGYLGSADDKDWFTLTPASDSRVIARVHAPAGVDVALLRGESAVDKPIDQEGPGHAEEMSQVAPAGQPVFVGIARKAITGVDPKVEGVPGIEEPYELRIELEPK
ncbi:MAG TPA: protein kinase [Polyangia bacterium]|nr:protein kinase [Polyangia bacterium]